MAYISRLSSGMITALYVILLTAQSFAASPYGSLAIGVLMDLSPSGGGVRGSVYVLKGSANGATAANSIFINSDTSHTPITSSLADFGKFIVAGDFNNDGISDIAIGAPNLTTPWGASAGVVFELMNRAGETFQGYAAYDSSLNSDFGSSLAIGDFNNDGLDDLAIGDPYYDVGTKSDAGGVIVIYGHNGWFLGGFWEYWNQDTLYIDGVAEAGDNFGAALATGDFNGDGYDDLVIGVPGEDIGTTANAGAFNIIFGSASGLVTGGNKVIYQGLTGFLGTADAEDGFGFALATGDFDNDGFDDLAAGVPGEDVSNLVTTAESAGAVHIFYGNSEGYTLNWNWIWTQNSTGMNGSAQDYDNFGYSLAAADFNGDFRDDLAIGIRGETVNSLGSAGSVQIMYGAPFNMGMGDGLLADGNQIFHQDSPGINNQSTGAGDKFGHSLAAGDLNHDNFADLAIGVPYEGSSKKGCIHILYGTGEGLSTVGNQVWDQESEGIDGTGYSDEYFGWSLAYIPPINIFPWPMIMPAIINSKGK